MPKEETSIKKVMKPMIDTNRYDSVENLSFNFDKFLLLIKKQKKLSVDDKITNANNHKILLEKDGKKKIIWYARAGKMAPVVLWSTMINRNCKVKNIKEAQELIKSVAQ